LGKDCAGAQSREGGLGTILRRRAFLEKEGLGKVRREYQKNIKKKLPEDTQNVMLDHDKASKAIFQGLKTDATYKHIIHVGYDGRTVSNTTQDPAELGRIYTKLWWNAEGKWYVTSILKTMASRFLITYV
jgi:hypothetical protein